MRRLILITSSDVKAKQTLFHVYKISNEVRVIKTTAIDGLMCTQRGAGAGLNIWY